MRVERWPSRTSALRFFAFSATYRPDEIPEMVFLAGKLFDPFTLTVYHRSGVHHHVTAFALHAGIDAVTAERGRSLGVFPRPQVVNLIEHRRGGEVVVEDLRVGHLAGVVEEEPATDAHHPARQGRLAQQSPRDIDLVDSLVARFPVAHVPSKAAIILDAVAIDGLLAGRPAPKIVIQRFGYRQRFGAFADRGPRLIGETYDVLNLSQLARADVLGRQAVGVPDRRPGDRPGPGGRTSAPHLPFACLPR